MRELGELLTVLGRLQSGLYTVLNGMDDGEWDLPTPAPGWTIRDQVAHLADTEEVAAATLAGKGRTFQKALAGYTTAEEFTEAGCARGRGMATAELLRWWSGSAARTRRVFPAAPDGTRVAWGLGMGLADFARARIMEHWAHGLDIRSALGVRDEEAGLLEPVARLALASLPYALVRAGIQRPRERSLRLVLTDGGHELLLGPREATDTVAGPLVAWCRVAVQRPHPGDRALLVSSGPLAALAVAHARAYL